MKISHENIGKKGIPCFIIAEVGLNHNGDYDLARKSIEAATHCGVNAVKFQNFKTEDFLTDRTIIYTYKSQGQEKTEPLYDICKRSEFKREWLVPLRELCEDLDVEFISTPTSEKGVMDLVDAGVKVLKNGSDYLPHIQLIKFMAEKALPIILSTGMAYTDDIDNAVNAIKETGNNRVILLHCVSNYPTEDRDVNLARMVSLRERYNLPVGFSDHTKGWQAAVQAVTLGACVIEKHFTLDKNLPGPDHWFSMDPDEMKTLVEEIRGAEIRMGSADIVPAESEIAVRDEFRLGIVASKKLEQGQVLGKEDVAFRKPCKGLLPKELDDYLGRRLNASVNAGEPIKGEYFS